MKFTIKYGVSEYDINIEAFTQLLGQNMIVKSNIIDSISKHFSSYKYLEYEEKYMNNVLLDSELPGRKMFEVIRVSNIEDIISLIKNGKNSIYIKCMKEVLAGYDCSDKIQKIDELLIMLFSEINRNMNIGEEIELQYEMSDIFDMVQRTDVVTKEGLNIHSVNNYNIVECFLKIINKEQELLPDKRLIIFENIDHYLKRDEYESFCKQCIKIAYTSNTYFIVSSSLDGFVYCDDELLEGINIINDDIFTMSSFEKLLEFIKYNYPCEKEWNSERIYRIITSIAQNICYKNSIIDIDSQVILNLINKSCNIRVNRLSKPLASEIALLVGDT